jgi:hypothetical protein
MSDSDNQTEPEVKKPSIGLTDIVQCVEVLRVCTERGVWRPSELSSVGQLYDRLSTFLTEAGVDLDAPSDNKDKS